MGAIQAEIEELVRKTDHLPPIFETILHQNTVFSDDEVILDSLFLEREGYVLVGEHIQKFENWQPARLLLATSYGVTILEEGGMKLADKFYGFRIKHILYEKIASLELDECLLSGELTITTSAGLGGETVIAFNTAKYYQRFEGLTALIRKQIVQS